ncbi:synaptic plasticity regulator PANTS-like isoform X2 [Oculina patagonica]
MSSIFGEENVKNETVTATEFKPPRCLEFLEKWRFCRSAKNQFHRYYIYGSMQDCSAYWKAFRSCSTYTFKKSSEAKVCDCIGRHTLAGLLLNA